MFNRLISNLPFNPSLIGQVSFYARRLKQETAIRRLGFIFVGLTLLVQMFAVFVPPQPSLAQDVNNDIIPGGFSQQADAVSHCNKNDYGFATILAHFGISCQALSAGKVHTIGSRDHNGQLFSMGRLPYGKTGEYAEAIPGAGTFYMRPLWSWDTGSTSSYQAIVGVRNDGTPFKVLFSCGNITIIRPPTPPPPPPVKSLVCDSLTLEGITPGSRVKKGTTVTAHGKAKGTNLPPGELVDFYYDYVDIAKGTAVILPELGAQGVAFSNGFATDPNSHTYKLDKPGHYLFRLAVKYDGSKKTAEGSIAGACARDVFVEQPPVDVCTNIPGNQTTREECDVCPEVEGTQEDTAACKPCDKSQSDTDSTACLVLAKQARNDTRNLENATEAKANELITYTLTVRNSGKITIKGFVISDNISDTLDYATITDFHSGSVNAQNLVTWPATDVKPGETIRKQLTIKIKDPIPNTPTSVSNPGKFDMTMTNVYGTTTNIKLPPTVVKTTEQIGTTLPNTGPGANMALTIILVSVVGYFFARARLLTKELDIVRAEYAAGS